MNHFDFEQCMDSINSAEVEHHFHQRYYQSLHVPKSRLTSEGSSSIFSGGAEITRDEYRFLRFIDKLQQQFVTLFYDLLKTQLICKGITDENDWEEVNESIQFVFENDNTFHKERKLNEISGKLNTLSMADAFVDKYYDKQWIMREILGSTETEIEDMIKADTDRAERDDEKDEEGKEDEEEDDDKYH